MGAKLDELISDLHDAQRSGDEDVIISTELGLAQYHYNNSNFVKARLFLGNILKQREDVVNVNYYLALIELNLGNNNKALEYLNNEIKINPQNEYAQKLIEKLTIHNNLPIMTLLIFFINLISFIYFREIDLLNSIKFGLSIFNLDFFSMITSLFIHINLIHFLVNMLILLGFGLVLEKDIGSLKFLLIYIVSGIIGNLSQVLLTDSQIILGASAALFGVLGAVMIKQPLLSVKIFFIFKIPIIFLLALILSFSFVIDIMLSTSFIAGTIAHIVGLFLGILFTGIFYMERSYVFYNWIFILFGFWIISYVLQEVYFNYWIYAIFSYWLIAYLALILVMIIIIVYSYKHLKNIEVDING